MHKGILFIVICVSIVVVFFIINFRTYNTYSQNLEEEIFNVKKGDDVIVIGRELAEKDIVANRFYLYYYVWKNKLRGSVNAGEYKIKPGSTIEEIMYKIVNGDSVMQKKNDIKVTFQKDGQ